MKWSPMAAHYRNKMTRQEYEFYLQHGCTEQQHYQEQMKKIEEQIEENEMMNNGFRNNKTV